MNPIQITKSIIEQDERLSTIRLNTKTNNIEIGDENIMSYDYEYILEKFKEKYSLETLDKEPLGLFDDICKRRGFILRGGVSDYTRCAKAVIDDFRKQRIGKICLEERP